MKKSETGQTRAQRRSDATNQFLVAVGERIREARIKKQMSQGELGERLGLNANTVSTYEVGAAELPVGRLHEIAEVLRVTPAWLAGGGASSVVFVTIDPEGGIHYELKNEDALTNLATSVAHLGASLREWNELRNQFAHQLALPKDRQAYTGGLKNRMAFMTALMLLYDLLPEFDGDPQALLQHLDRQVAGRVMDENAARNIRKAHEAGVARDENAARNIIDKAHEAGVE